MKKNLVFSGNSITKSGVFLLQNEIGINRSALQKMLQTLQKNGYIEKDDKGSWRVFITPSC